MKKQSKPVERKISEPEIKNTVFISASILTYHQLFYIRSPEVRSIYDKNPQQPDME